MSTKPTFCDLCKTIHSADDCPSTGQTPEKFREASTHPITYSGLPTSGVTPPMRDIPTVSSIPPAIRKHRPARQIPPVISAAPFSSSERTPSDHEDLIGPDDIIVSAERLSDDIPVVYDLPENPISEPSDPDDPDSEGTALTMRAPPKESGTIDAEPQNDVVIPKASNVSNFTKR